MYQHTHGLPALRQLAQYTIDELSELANKIASNHADFISAASAQELAHHASTKHEYGISIAMSGDKTESGILTRLSRRSNWLDLLKSLANRSREEFAVKSGVLGSAKEGKQEYCSDESYSLAKLADRNTNRKAAKAANQNYMTILGYSEAAFEKGFQSIFITLTCPSEFHSSSVNYAYKTFEDGHLWLTAFYQALFGYVSRKAQPGIDFWGIRTVEVHKDGCPHWHILIYATSEVEQLLRNRLRSLYERESIELKSYYANHHDEIIKARLPTSYDDYKEAISYVFENSYAGKGTSLKASVAAMRQRIAISCAGKRQYQLIGINGASKIKELRRHVKRESGIGGQAENLIVAKTVKNRNRLQLDALKTLLFGELNKYIFVKKSYKNEYGEMRARTASIRYRAANNDFSKVGQEKDDSLLALCLEICTGLFTFYVGVIFNSSSTQAQQWKKSLVIVFMRIERYGYSAFIRGPPIPQ
ncbi:MAG: hypothetical protein ACI8TV_000598 [Porticoccaceae bacterium]|jgi:hypothetical protein